MNHDQELLRAIIERRQQMLIKMTEQIKKEHHGLENQVANLVSALNSNEIIKETSKKN
jgi:predicted ArsR family transcriptional regulator